MEEKEEEEEGCGGPRDGRVGTGSQGTGFGRKDPRAPAVPPEWHSELWNSVRRLQREQRRSCPWRLAPALSRPCPAPAPPCPPPAGSAVPSLILQPRERSRRGNVTHASHLRNCPLPCHRAFQPFLFSPGSSRAEGSPRVSRWPSQGSSSFHYLSGGRKPGKARVNLLCSASAHRQHSWSLVSDRDTAPGRAACPPAEAAVQVSSGPPPLAGVCVSSRVHPACSSG